jgi:TPR repeat protein
MISKQIKLLTIAVFAFSGIVSANIKNPDLNIPDKLYLIKEYLPGNCKEEFNSKRDLHICNINKMSGFFKILPHINALKSQANWQSLLNDCKKDIDLNSRLSDYNKVVDCLYSHHRQVLVKTNSKDAKKQNYANMETKEIFRLAVAFLYGVGVEQNLALSARYFIKANEDNHKRVVQYIISLKYLTESNNIDTSHIVFQEAFAILDKAFTQNLHEKADSGDANVAYLLARKAERNDDYVTANKWYEVAIRENHHGALNNLGVNYVKGKGVEKDEAKGIELYVRAASHGSSYAQQTLGNRYVNGRGVTTDIDKGINYYQQSVAQNHAKAAYELAEIYRKGKVVSKDFKKAYENYLIAANRGHVKATSWIGYFYQFGKGMNKDLNVARQWYEKAGNKENPYAQQQLGSIYLYGKGTPIDLNKAYFWLTKASNQGQKKAMYSLANMLWTGQGIEMNKQEASKWYHKSAEKNYAMSQFWLGEMYARGDAVTKDLEKACQWTLKASKNKHKEAAVNYKKYCQ